MTQSLKATRRASPANGSTESSSSKGGHRAKGRRRANQLDGSAWTRHSISVWGDIRKHPEEQSLKHPAMFPVELASRLICCFTNEGDGVILDPFAGSGSTLLAAEALGKTGIGFDVSEEYVTTAMARAAVPFPAEDGTPAGQRMIYSADSTRLLDYVEPGSVDFVVTSPPYWDILLQRRTADCKDIRHYGNSAADLGKIGDYNAFLAALSGVFEKVYLALKSGMYCCAVVMDIRKKDQFYPLHADLASCMQEIGFIFDDIIIWDRGHEYNNLRPLGYPYVFRINKVHEYILIFKKPLRD